MHHAQTWSAGHGTLQLAAQQTLDRLHVRHAVPIRGLSTADYGHGMPSLHSHRHTPTCRTRAQKIWHNAWQESKPEDIETKEVASMQQPADTQETKLKPLRHGTDLQITKQIGSLPYIAQNLMANIGDSLTSGHHIVCTGNSAELHRATLVMTPVVQQILKWNADARRQHKHPTSQSLLKVKAVVICATREGAEQMHQVAYKLLSQHGLRAQLAQSRTPLSQDIDMLRAATPEIIAMTPGRALELLTQAPRGCKLHEVLGDVRLLVLDGVEQLLGSPALRVQTEPCIAALNSLWQQHHGRMTSSSTLSSRQVLLLDSVQQLSQETATHAAAAMKLFTGQVMSASTLTSIPQQLPLDVQNHSLTVDQATSNPKIVKLRLEDSSMVSGRDTKRPSEPCMTQAVHVAGEADITVHLFRVLRQHVKHHPRHRVLVMCPSVALARVWCRVAKQLGFAAFDFNTRKSSMYRAAALQAFSLRPGPHRPQSIHLQASLRNTQQKQTRQTTTTAPAAATSVIDEHASPEEAQLEVTDSSDHQHESQGSATHMHALNPADVDDIADLEEVWGAPGLVLFTAGGSTQDVHFPHLTCMLQVGLPQYDAQLKDFMKQTRTIAACRTSQNRSKKHLPESILFLSRHDLSGLSAFGTALEPLGIQAKCIKSAHLQTTPNRHHFNEQIPGRTQGVNSMGMLQHPSWATSSHGQQGSQTNQSPGLHRQTPSTATAKTTGQQQVQCKHHTSIDWVVVPTLEDHVRQNQQHANRVDIALSNIGTRLREVAWLSWMHHQHKHSMVKLPTTDAWLRMCRDFSSALALLQLPSVPKEVALEWGTAYMQGLKVAKEDVPIAQDDDFEFNAAMGILSAADKQSCAGSHPEGEGTVANVVINGKKQMQRESARFARRRLSRPYSWQAALYKIGDVNEDVMKEMVQKGLNKQYARRWRCYHGNLARWYQKLRNRRSSAADIDGKPL